VSVTCIHQHPEQQLCIWESVLKVVVQIMGCYDSIHLGITVLICTHSWLAAELVKATVNAEALKAALPSTAVIAIAQVVHGMYVVLAFVPNERACQHFAMHINVVDTKTDSLICCPLFPQNIVIRCSKNIACQATKAGQVTTD